MSRFRKVLAFAMALAAALTLASCSGDKDGGAGKGSGADLISTSPTQDPHAYLEAASGNTAAELAERYSGSPLAAISQVLGTTGELDLNLSVSDPDIASMEVRCALTYDAEARTARLDAAANMTDIMELDGSVYLSPDFAGVSLPILFGDDAFYGVRPYGLYDQASGSVLAGYMDPEDLELLKELDAMLSAFSQSLTGLRDMEEQLEEARASALRDIELTAKAYSGELNGKKAQGWSFSGEMDGGDIAGILEKYRDLMLDSAFMDTLQDLGGSAGSAPLGDVPDFDGWLREIRDSGVSFQFEIYVLEGRVSGFSLVSAGGESGGGTMAADFYDEGAVSFAIAAGGESIAISSAVDSQDGYSHEMSVAYGDGSVTVRCGWSADGALTLDVSSPEGDAGLRASLLVSGDGFTLSDVTVASQGESVTAPMTLSYTPGVSPKAPESTRNLFELTEEDYEYLSQILGSVFLA